MGISCQTYDFTSGTLKVNFPPDGGNPVLCNMERYINQQKAMCVSLFVEVVAPTNDPPLLALCPFRELTNSPSL